MGRFYGLGVTGAPTRPLVPGRRRPRQYHANGGPSRRGRSRGSDARPLRVHRRARTSGPRIFPVAFVVFFGAGAIWSAATPLLGAPDEPSQIIKAASVVRGYWTTDPGGCYVPLKPVSGGPACVNSPSLALGFENLPTFYDLLRVPTSRATDPFADLFQEQGGTKGSTPASCAESVNRAATASDIHGGYDRFSRPTRRDIRRSTTPWWAFPRSREAPRSSST